MEDTDYGHSEHNNCTIRKESVFENWRKNGIDIRQTIRQKMRR